MKVADRHVAAHNARSRRYGRARPGDGAVFRYEALAAHQTFEAAVVCDDRADAEALHELLAQGAGLRLGGSDTAGYGAARIEQVSGVLAGWLETKDHKAKAPPSDEGDGDAEQESPPAAEVSPPAAPEAGTAPARFTLTLLSDALLRDENGQWALGACAVARAVEARLGLTPDSLSVADAFFRGHVVGGFNRTWGLPLPQAQALQMGSVFVLEGPPLPPAARLESLGLGERRAEGFGRVALNWSYGEKMTEDDASVTPGEFSGVVADGPARTEASRLAGRLFERRLEERVEEAAGTTFIVNPPRGAQIGRLRDVLRDVRRPKEPDLTRVQDYLDDVGRRASAAQQFRDARVNGTPMDQWLKDWLTAAGGVPSAQDWQKIKVWTEGSRRVGGLPPDVADLWPGAVLRYLDAVLARAAKQARRREEEE